MLFANRPAELQTLRDVFAAAGFTPSRVIDAIGPVGLRYLQRDDAGPALRRAAGASRAETLVQLFVCGIPVPIAAAEHALAPLSADVLAAEGLVVVEGAHVSAELLLMPVAEANAFVPYDRSGGGAAPAADFVVGVGPASMTLAGLTIRHPAKRCLDLGTGGGIQALLAAPHADSVVATDRNPRAVAFAQLAMALNGTGNVDVREGDLFAPVAGERFDLIVANPPFVISPEHRLIYRDSGLIGDEISRRIVTEAPAHLDDAGWCHILANWAHIKGQHWQDRLAEWVDGLGCDAWVVQSSVQDAETYAATWIRHDNPTGDTSELFDAWMDFYEGLGLEAVGFGLITLRKTDRPNPWICLEELSRDFVLPCGNEIANAFDRAVWLMADGSENDALLATRLVVNPDLNLRQSHYAADGEWFLDAATLELDHGLHYATVVDALIADLVAGCDGMTPLGDLVTRLADSIGLPVNDVAAQTLTIVRRLLQQGLVTPMD